MPLFLFSKVEVRKIKLGHAITLNGSKYLSIVTPIIPFFSSHEANFWNKGSFNWLKFIRGLNSFKYLTNVRYFLSVVSDLPFTLFMNSSTNSLKMFGSAFLWKCSVIPSSEIPLPKSFCRYSYLWRISIFFLMMEFNSNENGWDSFIHRFSFPVQNFSSILSSSEKYLNWRSTVTRIKMVCFPVLFLRLFFVQNGWIRISHVSMLYMGKSGKTIRKTFPLNYLDLTKLKTGFLTSN